MRILIFNPQFLSFNTQISSKYHLFQNPSYKNPIFFRKYVHHPATTQSLSTATSSESQSFNGWDDTRLVDWSAHSTESTQFRNLLNSLGIDQKRYIFVYLLGVLCALAVSRIRVSSIIVFPACAIVFATGFSIGFVKGGHFGERSNLVNFKGYVEKFGDLIGLFDGFDRKINNLKISIRRKMERKHLTVDDLEEFIEVIESIGLSSLNGKSVVQKCIDSLSIDTVEMEKLSSEKSSKKRKGVGESGIYLFKLFGSLFREASVDPKAGKVKVGNKKELTDLDVNDQSRGNILGSKIKEKVIFGNESDLFENNYNSPDEIRLRDEGAERDFQGERFRYQGNRVRFVNSQRINVKMGPHNEVETWTSTDNFLDSMDFCVDSKNMETETFRKKEEMFGKINRKHWDRNKFDDRENEVYRPHSEEEERISVDDDRNMVNYLNEPKNDEDSFPSSSVSNDILFNEYLMEATAVLKQAREYLKVKGDEGKIESLLYDAARLFSKAIEMKPMSLLGVGQLGNTYLLHGELKLKRTRRLRAILIESDEISSKRRGKVFEGTNDPFEKRDRIGSMLIRVCEECEELLVKAGKQYRLALSIDGNDMRAMYNWGLALSFRAQLIADIGPEAAFDADKVFLAAIDKFDAMMSKSNVYAPDALFRWGVALQQRSRLQPRNKNEKVKLLQQAKRLYEDALDMDSDNMQVREALGSCIDELDFRNY